MSRRSAAARVEDILAHAEKAMAFLAQLPDPHGLAADERTLFAIVRALEVVGEASKRVPAEVRSRFPDLPWRQMGGMRDRLTHDYFEVDPEIVRRTVLDDLPPLLPRLRAVLEILDMEERAQGDPQP